MKLIPSDLRSRLIAAADTTERRAGRRVPEWVLDVLEGSEAETDELAGDIIRDCEFKARAVCGAFDLPYTRKRSECRRRVMRDVYGEIVFALDCVVDGSLPAPDDGPARSIRAVVKTAVYWSLYRSVDDELRRGAPDREDGLKPATVTNELIDADAYEADRGGRSSELALPSRVDQIDDALTDDGCGELSIDDVYDQCQTRAERALVRTRHRAREPLSSTVEKLRTNVELADMTVEAASRLLDGLQSRLPSRVDRIVSNEGAARIRDENENVRRRNQRLGKSSDNLSA